jgi:hypothetical protein
VRVSGCAPVSSETEATSSQASVAANIRGLRKRNAAAPTDATTPAKTPSGKIFRKDRRDLSGLSISFCSENYVYKKDVSRKGAKVAKRYRVSKRVPLLPLRLCVKLFDAAASAFLPELHQP